MFLQSLGIFLSDEIARPTIMARREEIKRENFALRFHLSAASAVNIRVITIMYGGKMPVFDPIQRISDVKFSDENNSVFYGKIRQEAIKNCKF